MGKAVSMGKTSVPASINMSNERSDLIRNQVYPRTRKNTAVRTARIPIRMIIELSKVPLVAGWSGDAVADGFTGDATSVALMVAVWRVASVNPPPTPIESIPTAKAAMNARYETLSSQT